MLVGGGLVMVDYLCAVLVDHIATRLGTGTTPGLSETVTPFALRRDYPGIWACLEIADQ
jgi:hypothetical protein